MTSKPPSYYAAVKL